MAVVDARAESAVDPVALARTYNNPVYDDSWASVEDYYDAMAFTDEYQNPSATAVARELDLPRRRIRGWFDGSRPDAVRGLEAARQHGWLPVEPGDPVFRGLNVLVAWNLSGGSITKGTFVPQWTVNADDDRAILDRAAELANTILDTTRAVSAAKTTELRPARDASVLGRVLYVLGVPAGPKNAEQPDGVPDYLEDASEQIRREFVQTYVHTRGQVRDDSSGIQLTEERSAGYRESLAALFEAVTGEAVSVSGPTVRFSVDAAEAMAVWPPLLGIED